MSAFQTFFLLFKADATQLKKETDEVKKKTNETTKSFKDAEDQTKKTDNEFVNLAKSLSKVAAAYFSVGSVIATFKSSIDKTTNFGNLSRVWDVPIETLSVWSELAKDFGVDSEQFINDIRGLSEKFRWSGEKTFAYLPTLADDFKKLKDEAGITEANLFGKHQLDLQEESVFILSQGGKALQEIIDRKTQLGLISQKDVEKAREFNRSTAELSQAFDNLVRLIVSDLLPHLEKLAKFLTEIVGSLTSWYDKLPGGDISNRSILFETNPSKLHDKIRQRVEGRKEKEPDINDDLNAVVDGILNKGTSNKSRNKIPALQMNEDLDTENQRNLPPLPLPQFLKPTSFNDSLQIPTIIPSITNSQARNSYFGNININTTSQDAKEIGKEVVNQVAEREDPYWYSNSYFDNSVIV